MESKNFNEVLKAREAAAAAAGTSEESDHIALDDTQRVKVLSPGRLVFNRFIRNKLAIVGSAILIFMFMFSFLFPLFYKYGQTDIFYKYDSLMTNYASASERDSYTSYPVDPDHIINSRVKNMITSYINDMEEAGVSKQEISDEESGLVYNLNKLGDNVYELTGVVTDNVGSLTGFVQAASFNAKNGKSVMAEGFEENAAFDKAASKAVEAGETGFEYGGTVYSLSSAGKKGLYKIFDLSGSVLEMADGSEADEALREAVLENIDSADFTYNDVKYSVEKTSADKYSLLTYGDAAPLMVSSTFVYYLCVLP